MRLSHFFIDRPIFAAVISTVIFLVGLFSYSQLSLSQYPNIAPPTISISAAYPGATAEDVAEQVAAPLEQEINGVEGMLYMTSSSTADGRAAITVTFTPETDVATAQVRVQNRVSRAESRLPSIVRQTGVTVEAAQTNFLLLFALRAPDGSLDTDYLGNYASTEVKDRLLRIDGVSQINIFGSSDYAMRVWIDPSRAAARGLTAQDIVNALREQNVQTAGGVLGQPPFDGADVPSFQVPVQVRGRLIAADEFADVVIDRTEDGAVTRLRDVARVELGSVSYLANGYFGGVPGIGIGVIAQPGANALVTEAAVMAELRAAAEDFPEGMDYIIPYNPTEFVAASVEAVQQTLIEAALLVMLVIIIFLQTWRAAVVPIIAIPVSIVGVFAIQLALGYGINSLTLFGMVLAVGIVVDDAIVVVENTERLIREGLSPRDAARKSMMEVGGALVAMSLTLISVFVPTAFLSGIPGIFYRQFAVAVASATVISLLVSLTLTPALCALLLREHRPHNGSLRLTPLGVLRYAGHHFNEGFSWLSNRYGLLVGRLTRLVALVLIGYGILLGATAWRLDATPRGFIPDQDQGFLLGILVLPPGTSLAHTDDVVRRIQDILLASDGVDSLAAITGLDVGSLSLNSASGTFFIRLEDFADRQGHPELSAGALAGRLTAAMNEAVPEGLVFMISPPAVPGLGRGGGFKMMVMDRAGQGTEALQAAVGALVGAANADPRIGGAYSGFSTSSPRANVEVDRDRAQRLGVDPQDVFDTLGTYLGSTYVNDFNFLGRTFRVTAQADAPFRDNMSDIGNLQVRSASGEMVPISAIATVTPDSGPTRVVRHNIAQAIEVQGNPAVGVSSGTALEAMEELADATLPQGFAWAWTEIAYQERAAGNAGLIVFAMAVVFVYLVLAAQYEAFTLPFAVIFIVPMCILAAMFGIGLLGMDNNILTQVGLVVLIALAAKNAILLVEFAKQMEEGEGVEPWVAAAHGARIRLRPILMTSIAFIMGVTPLAFAHGAGAEMRQALGIAVFSGMIGVTFFGLIFTPVFYVVGRWISVRLPRPPHLTEKHKD